MELLRADWFFSSHPSPVCITGIYNNSNIRSNHKLSNNHKTRLSAVTILTHLHASFIQFYAVFTSGLELGPVLLKHFLICSNCHQQGKSALAGLTFKKSLNGFTWQRIKLRLNAIFCSIIFYVWEELKYSWDIIHLEAITYQFEYIFLCPILEILG